MTNSKNRHSVFVIFLFVICSNSCITNQKNTTQLYHTVDSISGDFNKDGLIETIRVLNNKNEYYLTFYNFKDSILMLNKNIFFKKGDLGKDSDFIYLSYNDNILTITQEFGASRPDGWYLSYFSFHNNELFIDSIAKITKLLNVNDELGIDSKTKTIIKPLNNFNLSKELLEL